VRELIRFRRQHPAFQAERFWAPSGGSGGPTVTWHGVRPFQPDWGSASRSLAFTLSGPWAGECVYVALNAYWEPLRLQLPPAPDGRRWHRVADTALAPPADVAAAGAEVALEGDEYRLESRAVLVLTAR
jgi:glycogen operon protein